ncbi:MAG: EexN family lipoprotein [Zoogloeaceae bacterium]|nr:EexN family lipoprotein [Zoogloeaceae bacterium]
MRTAMTVLAVSFILAACAKEPIDDVHTVDWFLDPANMETFISIQELCKSNPGEYGKKPNCVNVGVARRNLYDIDSDGNFTSKTYTLEQVDRVTNGGASAAIRTYKNLSCLEGRGTKSVCDAYFLCLKKEREGKEGADCNVLLDQVQIIKK